MKITASKISLFSTCLTAAILFGSPTAHAVNFIGDGGSGGVWSNPAHWEGGAVPGPGGSAEIIDKTVFLDVAATVGSITLSGSGNGGYLHNVGGNTITVLNRLEMSRGGITGGTDGHLDVVLPGSATLVFTGPTFQETKDISGNVTIFSEGRIEWSGGPVYFSGILHNGGVFAVSADAGFGDTSRSAVINNTGRIVKQSGGGVSQFSGFTAETNQINTTLNNTGTVEVASGTLQIGSGTSSGTFEISQGKVLLVGGNGTQTFSAARFTGTGTCRLASRVTFLGRIESSATMELVDDSGIAGGDTADTTATLAGSGGLNWLSGRMTGNFTIAEGVRTTLSGPAVKSYDGTFVNKGTMDWTGPGPLATNSSTFRNEGTFNVLAAGNFLADTYINGQTFENVGTLNTFPGGTNSTDDTLIVNSGTVNIGGFGRAGILTTRLLQTATGSLQMEIGGASGDVPEFDQLRGLATLDGALSVDVINGYVPPEGARFTLVASHDGKFARISTPGGTTRFAIEYPNNSRTDLVSLSDAPLPSRLWAAGRDLARNEVPDRAAELQATNARFPQWSYGYRATAAGTDLTPFTPEQHINDNTGLHGWIGNGQATLGVNTKGNPIVFNTGSGDYRPLFPDQIYLAPGSGNEFLVVRWTAPEAGDYRLASARWLDLDENGGNGATAYVVRNGNVEFQQAFESKAGSSGRARFRAQVFSLNAGETLDFVVGSNGEHLFDATGFNAAIVRVPQVAITSPASGAEFTGPQDVTFEVDVAPSQPGLKVTLTVDDAENVASDTTAPYSLQARLNPGYHKIAAVAIDRFGARVESPEIVVVVAPGSAARAKPGISDSTRTAAALTGVVRRTVKGGGADWFDASTWNPAGAPTRNDLAIIEKDHAITISGAATIGDLTVDGSLSSSEGGAASLDVYGKLYVNGRLQNLQVFIQTTGKFLNLRNTAVLKFIELTNFGRLVVTANQFDGEGVTIENRGTFRSSPPVGSEGPLQVNLASFNQLGGVTTINAGAVIGLPRGVAPRIEGALQLSPGHVIARDGASVIARDGAGVIARDGASLVGLDGGSLVGLDGGTLVGLDGGSLVGLDGGSLVGLDGGTLVGLDGGTFRHRNSTATPGVQKPRTVAAEVTQLANIILAAGTVTGTGELRGNVTNQSSYISPGSSAGVILVNGGYTQEAGGTLLLEVGGKNLATSYDAFQVADTATLGGNLIVKTIDGFTPAAADSFTPLLYGSVTGNFANISSNAQVTLDSTGMNLKVSGPNPPGPKALNIATRMRVETGDNVLIAGFIITGTSSKKVLVRGIGPSLPVDGALADPTLDLDAGAFVNDDWRSSQQSEIEATTIPPSSDVESAIVATLAPGAHTAVLRGKNNGTGVGLVEVYDLERDSPVQLANISTRGQVQTGDNVMIGGFIIAGDYPAKVLLRAIGPSLPVEGALQDPTLELVDSNGATISNDDWRESQEAEVIATTVPPTNDNEAAIVATLVPGAYTAVVRGKDDTVGVALVEGYNLQ